MALVELSGFGIRVQLLHGPIDVFLLESVMKADNQRVRSIVVSIVFRSTLRSAAAFVVCLMKVSRSLHFAHVL